MSNASALNRHEVEEAFEPTSVSVERIPAIPMPLRTREEVLGLAFLFVERERLPLSFLQAVHGQLSIALGSWTNKERAVEAQRSAIFQLALLSAARDGYGEEHLRRVQEYTRAVARELGLEEAQVENIAVAAAVHDVGKIRVPEATLNKPGKLTEEEFAEVKKHAEWGDEVLEQIGLETARRIARHHHEWCDGKGYPDGLAGKDIPLPARIVAVADVFDALTSARPYKRAWTKKEALDTIQSERGTHFDPEVHDAFLRCCESGHLSDRAPSQ